MDVAKAFQKQLQNIETRTGKSLAELAEIVRSSGLARHGEIRDMLKSSLGLGHGDANTLTRHVLGNLDAQEAASSSSVLDDIYQGPKAALRPIHERLMAAIEKFGEFEVSPKKGYVSLRRKKQFAMLGPATNTRFELGINAKGLPGTDRLVEQPPGGMCQYKVKLTDAAEVDDEIVAWIKAAYDAAG